MNGPGWRRWLLALLAGMAAGLACGYDSSPPEEAVELADAGEVPGADGSTGAPDAGSPEDGGVPDAGVPDSGTPGGRCTSASCDDQNPCTQDSCTPEGQCVHSAVEGGCEQGGRPGCCDKGLCCVGPLCCQ